MVIRTVEAIELELQSFSDIVSHDLAASLRHLAEFSRLLVNDLAGGLTDRQRPHADPISIGVGAEYLAEIFKPLVRLHTAAEFPSTGLGLLLTRKAVIAQNGAIWCESTPGAGSTPISGADPGAIHLDLGARDGLPSPAAVSTIAAR